MNNKNDNLGFGIRVHDMFEGAWSFGICLSHGIDETYIFINLFNKSIAIGWLDDTNVYFEEV